MSLDLVLTGLSLILEFKERFPYPEVARQLASANPRLL